MDTPEKPEREPGTAPPPQTLAERVKEQFPNLFITLVSVLIGLVFQDLVTEARARMHLWPLNMDSLRTWSQLFANGTSAMTVWIVYAHIGVSRKHIPTLGDSLFAILPPVLILAATSFVGQQEVWPWFYVASVYLVSTIVVVRWNVQLALAEQGLAGLALLVRPKGMLLVPMMGAPFFAAVGWASQHRMLSPAFELLCAVIPTPAALWCVHLFFRDWHRAIGAVESDTQKESLS